MSERRRIVVVLTVCFLISFICMSIFNIAHAAPGLTQQISINDRANKVASAKCGAWSKNISNTRKTCRAKVLKSNGYIPLYDLSDLPPVPRLDPHAPPVADTYAAR